MSDDFPLPVPPSKDRNVLAVELISGSFGGAAQVISGQPLDTLKTVSSSLPINGLWPHSLKSPPNLEHPDAGGPNGS